MNHYLSFGFDEFILATGYKNEVFKSYFKTSKEMEKVFHIIL